MTIGMRLGLRMGSGGGAPPPTPATIFKSFTELAGSLIGFYTIPSAGRGNLQTAGLAFRVKGSSASLYGFSGDATPFRVVVDSDDFTTRVIPNFASSKIPLFTGLSDTWHDVFVYRDNSGSGQGINITGNLLEVYGSNADAQPMGQIHYVNESSFPGVSTVQVASQANYPLGFNDIAQTTGWTTRPCGSLHFRARFDKLYVFCHKTVTSVMLSIDGAVATLCTVSDWDDSVSELFGWRLINTPASPSTYKEMILSGGGNNSVFVITPGMGGLMAVGSTASVIAPTGTKRHVAILGASQVEGVNVGAGGYRSDMHLAQNRLPIYVTSNGLAGGTITALTTAIPTIAPRFRVRDIAVLSIGINSADDANFQGDYQALITAVLAAGWTKVICRGLVTTLNNDTKNAKIEAAVTAIGNANVVYASVSTWTATTDGSGGSIAMPDGAHPNAAGFATMADFMVRDHASLFV